MLKNLLPRRLVFSLIALSIVATKSYGQSDPQFTQYIFNQFYLNPAMAGMSTGAEVSGIFRSQWTGYSGSFDQKGAPTTQQLSFNSPVSFLKGGVGVYISNDNIGGGTTNREVALSYSLNKRVGPNTYSAAISAGIYAKSLDGTLYRPRDENDPSIPLTNVTQVQPDLAVGVAVSSPTYSIGAALKHITKPTFNFNTAEGATAVNRMLYLSGSLNLGVTYTLDITPMFVIKSDFNTVSPEVGALFTYNSRYYAGLNYRYQDAAGLLIGGRMLNNKLRIGYALDYVIFGATAKAPLSHEFMLTYSLPAIKFGKKSIIKTPRYSF